MILKKVRVICMNEFNVVINNVCVVYVILYLYSYSVRVLVLGLYTFFLHVSTTVLRF